MKKLLLNFAVLAAFASCAKNEIAEIPASKQAIEFGTLNDRVTKVANDGRSNYEIYAKSNVAGETNWFINKEEMKSDDISVNSNSYYWPAGGETVSFWAYAPKSGTNIVVTPLYATPSLSINYTVSSDAQEDFTIAAPRVDLTKVNSGKTVGTVDFVFAHMLSKITVEAKMVAEMANNYTITFTDALIGEVPFNNGTVDATDATQAWKNGTALVQKTSYNKIATKSYMIYPQVATGITVQLRGAVIKKGNVEVYNGNMKAYIIKNTDKAGGELTFEKGKHYKIILSVSSTSTDEGGNPIFGDEIKFSSSVADWDTVGGTDTPLDQN